MNCNTNNLNTWSKKNVCVCTQHHIQGKKNVSLVLLIPTWNGYIFVDWW
jgi:hypothetical protein